MSWKAPALAALLALFASFPALAAVPPLPDDLSPKPWKPEPEMGRLIKEIEEAGGVEEQAALMGEIRAELDAHPDWVDLHRHYIGIALRADRFEEVKASYRERLARDSTNADLQYLNGILEQGAAGEPYHRRALQIDPKHYHARVAHGLALLAGGPSGYEEAFQDLLEAARARPDHPYAYMGLTLAYRRAGDAATALRVIDLWKKVEPGSSHPLQFEVAALQAAGREADAAKVQVQVAEMSKTSGEQAIQAARLLAKQGQTAEAARWLKAAAERGFDDPRALQNDPDLKALQGDPGFVQAVSRAGESREKRSEARRARLLEHMITKAAPGFSLKTLEGEEVSLEGLRGKVVVLDFWATWCGPCRMTLPLVRDLHATLKSHEDVEILCMNVWERDAERARVAPYWKENAYPMKVGLASSEDAKNYGVNGIPTLFVIDQSGQIRFQHVGYTPYMDEEVAWVVEALLDDSASN